MNRKGEFGGKNLHFMPEKDRPCARNDRYNRESDRQLQKTESEAAMVNKVRVNIAGAQYAFATTDSEKYITSLADKLDRDISKLMEANPSLPVTGAVIVDTPQSLVKMIVEKALNMANMMHIPVLGIIENMSTFICDQCGKRHDIFGESHTGEIAEAFQIPLLAQIPLRAEVRRLVDEGKIEDVQVGELSDFLAALCEK